MMVKKRGPLDRIEKVVKKRRFFHSVSDTSSVSPRKDRNMLNDHLLNLYKAEIPSNPESSVKNNFPTPDKKVVQNDGTGELKKNPNKVESSGSQSRKSIGNKSPVFTVKNSTLTLKDVGGLDEIISDIFKLFLPWRHPKVFTPSEEPQTVGFLLHGHSGCGKTYLARAIAGELGVPYIEVAAKELVSGPSRESESKIRDLFDEAIKNAPCILFLDKIDTICRKREKAERDVEMDVVSQLGKCLDELNERDISSSVMVIGATNRPDSIDPDLKGGSRFEKEFEIGIPDEDARFKILQVLCRNQKLFPELDMHWIAHHTPGYLGADLKGLKKQAVEICRIRLLRKLINKYGESPGLGPTSDCSQFDSQYSSKNYIESVLWCKSKYKEVPEEEFEHYIELQDFQDALRRCVPYIKREGFVTVPDDVTWDDVGALEEIKKELRQAILWPVKYPKKFKNAPRASTKGIILYGPKGCGKTLLAKAIANECSMNFISVKGPELLNMYLGESEKAVRQLFQRARNSAPCVIFFDEFDALCPRRSGSNANAAADRVVTQMLTEMDGLEVGKQVFVLGATNRLKKIDSAILRPGRIEKCIYVGLPSPDGRIEILKSLTKNKTRPKLADDVDLEKICFDSRCEGFSGADMFLLINTAFDEAMSEDINSPNCSPDDYIEVKMKHFEHALSIVKPSVTKKEIKYFQRSLV